MISTTTALAIDSAALFVYQLAMIIMKIAHHRTETSKSSGFLHPLWFLGVLLLIAVTVVRVSVLPYADLLLFTATSSLSVVYGVFLAIVVLGERFVWRYDVAAIALILVGCVLTVLQCNFTQTIYTADKIVETLTGWMALGFLFIATIVFAATVYFVRW